MTFIADDALVPAQVPSPRAPWAELERFALTFDGSRHAAALAPVWAAFVAGAVPADLHSLRGCLYLLQRSWRHVGRVPDRTGLDQAAALVVAIRGAVAARSGAPRPSSAPQG